MSKTPTKTKTTMTKKSKSKPPNALEVDEANEGLFEWGGRLRNLRHGVPDYDGESIRAAGWLHVFPDGPLGAQPTWLEPDVFEQLCDADPAVKGAIRHAKKANYSPESLTRVAVQLRRVFEEQYLARVDCLFESVLPTYARYFAAKAAWLQQHPEEVESEPAFPDAAVPLGPADAPRVRDAAGSD